MSVAGKLPGPVELFKQAWQIYKQRFWVLVGISIVPTLLILILGLVAGGSVLAGAALGVHASAALVIVLVILAILVYVAVIYIALWSQASLLFAIKGADQRVGFKDSFRQGSHKVFSLFGAGLLVGLAIMGLTLVGGGIVFALYAILPKMAALFFVEGILGLIVFLWIIKFIVEYSLASYVIVGDNTKALSAVQRSRDYVKGHWWGVFGRGLFMLVIFFVYFIVVGLIAGALAKIPGAVGVIISQLVNLAGSVIATPLLAAYLYKIYENLRVVKGESQIPADKKSVGLIVLAVIVVLIVVVAVPVVLLALNSARAKSRDVKRMIDMRVVATELELYNNDHQSYPDSLSNLPTAPQPADGSCTQEKNAYQYILIDPQHYQVNFCLGQFTQGYSAGPHILTERGIQ